MFGRSTGDKYADLRMWKYSYDFMKRFREEIASDSILCGDIVNVNWMDQNQVKEYRKGQKREDCKKLTGRTAKLIGEIIERAIALQQLPSG